MLFIGMLAFLSLIFVNLFITNPVAMVLGYKFYDVTNSQGIHFTLLSKHNIQELANKDICYVRLDDTCFLEKNN